MFKESNNTWGRTIDLPDVPISNTDHNLTLTVNIILYELCQSVASFTKDTANLRRRKTMPEETSFNRL